MLSRTYADKPASKIRNRVIVCLFSFCIGLNPVIGIQAQTSTSSEPGIEAGLVILVRGEVIAADSSGTTRPLGRRDAIYVGDTVYTDTEASAQFRMVDGAQISLQPDTEFAIVAYEYEDSPQTDNATLDLFQGGFRTITGNISHENPAAYQARAAGFATIGIRGTAYEVVVTPAGQVLAGVFDGGITISNNSASLDLGIDADFDFGIVPNATTPPQGLVLQPDGLSESAASIANQTADDQEDEDQDEEAAGADQDSATDDTANNGPSDNADDNSAIVGTDSDNTANNNGNAPTNSSGGSTQTANTTVSSNAALAQPSGQEIAVAQVEVTARPVVDGTATSEEVGLDTAALRINPNENGSINGDVFSSGNGDNGNGNSGGDSGNGNSGGDTGNGNSGGDNGNGNSGGDNGNGNSGGDNGNGNSGGDNGNGNSGGNAGGDTDNGNSGGNSGGDTGNGNSGGNAGGDTGNGNSGGNSGGDTGNGNSGGNAGGDTGNGNSGGNSGGDTGNGNSGGNAGGDTGNGNSGGNAGGDTGNGNSGGNAGGDTGNGNSGGNSGGDTGNGNSGGNSGGDAGNGNSGGNSGGDTGNGNSGGNSGGDTGNGNSGGNSGGDTGNGNSGGNSGGDAGNGNSGGNSGGDTGNGNSGGNSGGDTGNGNSGGNSGGDTGNGNSGGNGNSNNITASNRISNGNGNGSGSNLRLPQSTLEQHAVSWGKWDSPVEENWLVVQEAEDGLVRVATSDYFADVNPAAIASMSGSHDYRTGIASRFIGSGSAGDISNLAASMAVDFDSGLISNGQLDVQTAEQIWSVTFDGMIDQGAVELHAIDGTLYNSSGVLSDQIDAQLGGAFTGSGADAFVGGFELIDELNNFNDVNGLFTIER